MKKSIFSALAAGVICVSAGCQNTQNVQEKESMKRSYTPPFKNANVSYTANKITKSIAVPVVNDEFQFGTGMTDPVWKKAAVAEDFEPYKHKVLEKPSKMAFFRTEKALIIGFFFEEAPANIVKQKNLKASIWSGDMAEIHFGAMEPDPWLMQLGVGVNGSRFDSTGFFDRWKSKVFVNEKGWGAELMIDNSALRLTEGGFRFNLCRQAVKRNELSCWSPLIARFHEVENFGELLFTDYSNAFAMRYGISIPDMTREQFEKLSAKYSINTQKVIHGPFVSNPTKTSVSIAWGTAGKVPSYLEYREKGSNAAPRKAVSGKLHGILGHNTRHLVELDDLEPGKEYEYEIFTLSPVALKPVSTKIKRAFRMPKADEINFSFIATSDIHSDVKYLRNAAQSEAGKKAAFHMVIGDLLSHAAGPEALYSGIVDPMVAEEKKNAYDRPLLFARGNHEQWGVYASDYFNVLRHPTDKTYYTFNYGDVFFIVLDTGNDIMDSPKNIFFSSKELLAEQREFLEKVEKTDAYRNAKYRIVFQHIPPLSAKMEFYKQFHDLLKPLTDSVTPPDAILCGHMHAYMRLDPNSKRYHEKSRASHSKRSPNTTPLPCLMLVNTNSSVIDCKVSPEKLDFTIFTPDKDGKILEIIDQVSVKAKK